VEVSSPSKPSNPQKRVYQNPKSHKSTAVNIKKPAHYKINKKNV
jgi:hypothetical protein